MTPEKLIAMANQIAAYFAQDPDPAYARGQIADHLRRSWSPAMRHTLIEHLDQGGDCAARLDALAAAAVAEHRKRLLGVPS